MAKKSTPLARTPLLEWIAAGTGLFFLLGLLGVIGYDGLTGASSEPPSISIRQGPISRAGSTFTIPFEAINNGGGTAAALAIEGRLLDHGRTVETSIATIDYVPGHGRADGGLFFSRDPKGLTLEIRPTAYQAP